MRRVSFRPLADYDLAEIWQFTAEHWGRGQADNYVAAIREVTEGLASHSERSPEAVHLYPGLRKARSGSHLIYFLANEQGVDVVRILHGSMDANAALQRLSGDTK